MSYPVSEGLTGSASWVRIEVDGYVKGLHKTQAQAFHSNQARPYSLDLPTDSAALAADEHTTETQPQSKRDSKLTDPPSSARKDTTFSLGQASAASLPSSSTSYTSAPGPGSSYNLPDQSSSSSQQHTATMLASVSTPRKPSPQSYGVRSQGQIRPTEQSGKSPSKKSKPVVHNTGKQVRIESISAKKLKDEGKWA
ncbi:hypothetical protein B0A48_06512 [Cryoendolithus antarcticus]|uniref:Uncharacterized protein n=1 Tax=Cryoendolithus antarcticus TaxID=1507870 RepID=A0A1V8TBS2_9PEZI|nr:hypothetical protein B0A48_06512 [Cryoendolithus antarcticus]